MINSVFQRDPILASRNPMLDHSKSHVPCESFHRSERVEPNFHRISQYLISAYPSQKTVLPHLPLPETKQVHTCTCKKMPKTLPKKVRLVTVKTCLSSKRFASFKPRSLAERRNGDFCNFAGAWAGHVAGNPVSLMRCAVGQVVSGKRWQLWQFEVEIV